MGAFIYFCLAVILLACGFYVSWKATLKFVGILFAILFVFGAIIALFVTLVGA